ncbi:MAG: hypothetical protein SwBeaMacB_28870 [Shewanella algae]
MQGGIYPADSPSLAEEIVGDSIIKFDDKACIAAMTISLVRVMNEGGLERVIADKTQIVC